MKTPGKFLLEKSYLITTPAVYYFRENFKQFLSSFRSAWFIVQQKPNLRIFFYFF